MQRRRGQQPALPARRGALLVSLLVLAAFAFVPGSAFADSAGVQYEDAIPSAVGSGGSSGGQTSSQGSVGGDGAAGASGGKDGKGGSGKGASARNGGQGANLRAGLGGSRAIGDDPSALGASADDSGGGSSPLLPMAIALIVLAAISGIALLVRARRQKGQPRSGTQPSAEVG